MKLKPPADATDFQEEVYRASLGIIFAQIRRGEFDKKGLFLFFLLLKIMIWIDSFDIFIFYRVTNLNL
jgi:hypothetical protein